jgi:hypothetical protein
MINFTSKPKTTSFYVVGYELTKVKDRWYTVHLNGKGYYGLLIDGRTVYSVARKTRKLEEYKAFENTLNIY